MSKMLFFVRALDCYYGWLLRPGASVAKRWLIGMPAALLLWVILQMGIVASGLLAAIVGLKNSKNYDGARVGNILIWMPLVFFGILFPWIISGEFALTQLSYLFIYTIVVMGLNILIGTAGLYSIGHAAFVALGAYFTAFFYSGSILGFSSLVAPSLILGGAVTGVIGFFLGYPAVRAKGPYLALITLAFMMSVSALLKSTYLEKYTGGSLGIFISQPEAPMLLGFISNSIWRYYINLVCFVSMLAMSYILIYRSKLGLGFRAVREGEDRSQVMGVNVVRHKMFAFGLSAFFAGVGGGLIALNTGFVGAESFTLRDSLEYLIAVAIGGFGSIFGSVVGGIFLAFSGQWTEFLAAIVPGGDQLLWAVFGSMVIAATLFIPRGVAGELKSFLQRRRGHEPIFDLQVDEILERSPRSTETVENKMTFLVSQCQRLIADGERQHAWVVVKEIARLERKPWPNGLTMKFTELNKLLLKITLCLLRAKSPIRLSNSVPLEPYLEGLSKICRLPFKQAPADEILLQMRTLEMSMDWNEKLKTAQSLVHCACVLKSYNLSATASALSAIAERMVPGTSAREQI